MTEKTLDSAGPRIVNQYFTPLAVVIVANGIILTQPRQPVAGISWALLAFSVLFNSLTIRKIDRPEGGSRGALELRIYVNYAVSALQVYLLGSRWEPAWLLLLLTPLASALYEARGKTVGFSLLSMALLLVLRGLRGPVSPIEWAQTLIHGALIVLLSLAVYAIARHRRGQTA